MKLKHLLFSSLMLLSAGTAWANVEINEENFPDENFRNYLLSQSYGSDGVLTDEEIAEVTSINVSFKSIHSLQGIEYFTGLTMLFCYFNQLTSLDVSKNTALTQLECYGNQISETAMDALIESLPKVNSGVFRVYYEYNERNLITTTQVAAAKAKGWITYRAGRNIHVPYPGIDPSYNVMIYVSNFPDEQFRNYLRSQDYGRDGGLSESEIKNITRLDVSNIGLKSLKGVEYFTALIILWCYSNQLTSLDVSKNTKLLRLECYDNQISETAMDALVESLPKVDSGVFRVYYENHEQNVMPTSLVAAAKAKGWTPYYTDGKTTPVLGLLWYEYEGVDLTTSINAAGASEADDSAPWYTINGTLLTGKPTIPGIYIHGGKKVIVK